MSFVISEENARLIPNDCMLRLRSVYDSLRSAEKKAADLLITDPVFFSKATIGQASERAGCSEATFVRLSRRLGYGGYPEFKMNLREHSGESPTQLYQEITEEDSDKIIAKKVFHACIQTLQDTLNIFDANHYSDAVNKIRKANKIVFCGVGDSSIVALAGYQKFLRAGICTQFSHDQNIQIINVAQLEKDDVLIAISHMGRSKSIVDLAKQARANGIQVISITNYPVSPLSKNSDILLLTAAFAEHIKGEVVSKRLAELCILECLYVNVIVNDKDKLGECLEKSNSALEINIL